MSHLKVVGSASDSKKPEPARKRLSLQEKREQAELQRAIAMSKTDLRVDPENLDPLTSSGESTWGKDQSLITNFTKSRKAAKAGKKEGDEIKDSVVIDLCGDESDAVVLSNEVSSGSVATSSQDVVTPSEPEVKKEAETSEAAESKEGSKGGRTKRKAQAADESDESDVSDSDSIPEESEEEDSDGSDFGAKKRGKKPPAKKTPAVKKAATSKAAPKKGSRKKKEDEEPAEGTAQPTPVVEPEEPPSITTEAIGRPTRGRRGKVTPAATITEPTMREKPPLAPVKSPTSKPYVPPKPNPTPPPASKSSSISASSGERFHPASTLCDF
ncbi:hypothetical protein HK104_001406 [Borealophlyctis nickersoniae]|nr:hypothetical protein HK104_001406 [Borealophlyctis nickersoniae]